jgi:hypothetical protein
MYTVLFAGFKNVSLLYYALYVQIFPLESLYLKNPHQNPLGSFKVITLCLPYIGANSRKRLCYTRILFYDILIEFRIKLMPCTMIHECPVLGI